jgi:hypothetical protein
VIRILFEENHKFIAEGISAELKVGNFIHTSGYVILAIYDKVEVLKVIKLINGCMRTKKIYQLHTAIKCFNQHDNSSIPLLGLDLSDLSFSI